MSDHVHMMISIPPKYAVSQVVDERTGLLATSLPHKTVRGTRMTTTAAASEYQLIGLTEGGDLGDCLTGLDQKRARIRVQALVAVGDTQGPGPRSTRSTATQSLSKATGSIR